MSESYPYFSISCQFGVPYGEVLDWVWRYEIMIPNEMPKPKGAIAEAVYSAVIAEYARRKKVIRQIQPSL